MKLLEQGSAPTRRLGPFLDATDADTPNNSMTMTSADVLLSKNGGTYSAKNDTTGLGTGLDGFYNVVLNATDTEDVGSLEIYINPTGSLYVYECFLIVTTEVYSLLMSETNSVNLDGRLDTAQADLNILTGSDGVTLATAQGNYAPNVVVPPSLSEFNARSLPSADYTVVTDLGTIQTADHTAALTAIAGYIDTEVGAIITDLGNSTDGLGALKTLIDTLQTTANTIKNFTASKM